MMDTCSSQPELTRRLEVTLLVFYGVLFMRERLSSVIVILYAFMYLVDDYYNK